MLVNSDIYLIKYNDLNCYDSVIANVGKIFNREIDLCFFDEFGFCYPNTGAFSLKTEVWHNYTYHIDLLREYCGIAATFQKDYTDIDKCIVIIQKELEKRHLIAIEIDAFYLPWSSLRIHRQHFILIMGQTDTDFLIADSYQCNDMQKLSINYLKRCQIDSLLLFQLNNIETTKKDILELIRSNKKNFQIFLTNGIPQLKAFCEDVLQINHKEEHLDNIESSDLLLGLSNICWSRKNFKCALQKIAEISNAGKFDETLLRLEQSTFLWGKAKQVLIKSILLSSKAKASQASEILQTVIELEAQIAEHIIHCV